jgi:hypothetical protein
MSLPTYEPFWTRPGLSRRVAAAWVAPAVVLGAGVATLALVAQNAADADARSLGLPGIGPRYPLAWHALAMVAVAVLAVAVSVVLVRAGARVAAGAVLVAAALGPMTLVATPLRESLVAPTSMDTVLWWHLAVAAAAGALLVGWTAGVVRALHGRPPRRVVAGRVLELHVGAFVVLIAAGYTFCLGAVADSAQAPGTVTTLGWATLAAGLALAVAASPGRVAATHLALAAIALGALHLAYHRPGGWPGVAGWEFRGMESPIVLTGAVAAMVLVATPAGLALRLVASLLPTRARRSADVPV